MATPHEGLMRQTSASRSKKKTNVSENPKFVLGLDFGTTSVKASLVDRSDKRLVAFKSKKFRADVESDQGAEGHKQSVIQIIGEMESCIMLLPKELMPYVDSIGVCGQMHGVMFWKKSKSEKPWKLDDGGRFKYKVNSDCVSSLYTWQDLRCTPDFLENLPQPDSHLTTHSGYGCNTIFWFSHKVPAELEKYNCAGTVQDFFVAMLADLEQPVMSVQIAASWGYFNCSTNTWNKERLQEENFPVNFLPAVVPSGQVVGKLVEEFYGIPISVPIIAALGDLQCSAIVALHGEHHLNGAMLNIATSAQVAFVDPNFDVKRAHEYPIAAKVERFPYFDGRYLTVAASLNGGNCLSRFVKMFQEWLKEFQIGKPQDDVWSKMIQLAKDESADSTLCVVPTMLGERHAPEQNASISNIDPGNLGLGQVFRAICYGIVKNLSSMMPQEVLDANQITHIICMGAALVRNEVLKQAVQSCYRLSFDVVEDADASFGAAIAVIDHMFYEATTTVAKKAPRRARGAFDPPGPGTEVLL